MGCGCGGKKGKNRVPQQQRVSPNFSTVGRTITPPQQVVSFGVTNITPKGSQVLPPPDPIATDQDRKRIQKLKEIAKRRVLGHP